jgi:diguanylate cyclase (GGDEF)-like protein/PAS domain S-box-containing protein
MSDRDRPHDRVAAAESYEDARYRATFHQAAFGIAHTAPDFAILDVNEAFCTMLGYSRSDCLHMRLSDLMLWPEQSAFEGSLDERARASNLREPEIQSHACTEQYRHKQGASIWVQRTVSLASDAAGRPYVIHFMEDITERRRAEELQRQSDLRYQRTLESALDCIITTDHLGRIIEFNPMAEKVFRYSRDRVVGRRLVEVLVPPRLRKRHEASMKRLLSDAQQTMLNRRIETIALRGDGTTIPVELMMQRITDAEPPLFTGFLRDITARKQAEAKILRLNRLYRTLSQTSALSVRAADRQSLFEGMCRVAKKYGGFIITWVGLLDVNGNVRLAAHDEGPDFEMPPLSTNPGLPEGRGVMGTALREGRIVICNDALNDPANALWRERHKQHDVRSLAALPLMAGGEVIGVFMLKAAIPDYFDAEITQLLREMVAEISHGLDRLSLEQRHRDATERLARLAHFDPLTNLPNRTLFQERLAHGIAQAARNGWTLGVMYIDLDRFKGVNDTLGHAAGDELLKQVGARVVECVRGEDTISRLSGDEFALVLAHLTDVDDAGVVAAKILKALKMPFDVEGSRVTTSASVGVTLFPTDGDNADVLMRNADVAMYNAKWRGRDNFQFYTAEMNDRAVAKMQLESRLRGALERNEFVLHFQPKVSIEFGVISAFEALIRWQPPGGALVSPGEFIPLLEETGLIRPVGEWVLHAACAQLARWRDSRLKPVPIAINLSARQLRHGGFCEAVARTLAEFDLEPHLIEVEITESSLMDNPVEAEKALGQLKTLGVMLAIDDFGTGYSSLGYLKRFPFDTLKIDRSFVRDMNTDPDDALITRTIIALAHSLDLTVVAEGVETAEQLEFLAAHRCDEAQGYLFSVPVPAERATALLRSGEPLHPPADVGVFTQPPAVLVVNAEVDGLVSLQQLLQRDGYLVLTANSLRDAVEVVPTQNIVAVIADESLADGSGPALLEQIRASSAHVVRILRVAAGSAEAARATAAGGLVQQVFVKDRDDRKLRELVRQVVRRKQSEHPAKYLQLVKKPEN